MADAPPSDFVSYSQLLGLNQNEIDAAKQRAMEGYNTAATTAASTLANTGFSAALNAQNGGSGDLTQTASYGDYLKSKDAMNAAYQNLTQASAKTNNFDSALNSAEVTPGAQQADLSAWSLGGNAQRGADGTLDTSSGGPTHLSDLERQWGVTTQQQADSATTTKNEVATTQAHLGDIKQEGANMAAQKKTSNNNAKQAIMDAWLQSDLGGKKYGGDLTAIDPDWAWRQAQDWAALNYNSDSNIKGLADAYTSTGTDKGFTDLISGGADAVNAAKNNDYSYTKGFLGLGDWYKQQNSPTQTSDWAKPNP